MFGRIVVWGLVLVLVGVRPRVGFLPSIGWVDLWAGFTHPFALGADPAAGDAPEEIMAGMATAMESALDLAGFPGTDAAPEGQADVVCWSVASAVGGAATKRPVSRAARNGRPRGCGVA